VEKLFDVIRDLKRRGVAIIYISHKLDEIFRVADMVTVLRDGRQIATHRIGELDAPRLITLMVGRELRSALSRSAAPQGEVALSVRGLGKTGKFRDVSFQLRSGEVLGLAGLMGAGRTDLLNAIFGLFPADAGEITVHGQSARVTNPRRAMARGIAMVTEDRKEYGFVPTMSVKHNLTLSDLGRCGGRFLLNDQTESRIAEMQVQKFAIKTHDANQSVQTLSGGNQQKVVLAKALLTEPSILILDEPTRGIDIGAKAEVYALIAQLARQGKAILMASSELPEILSLSDRILVMREGTVTAELDARKTTQEEIMTRAMPI